MSAETDAPLTLAEACENIFRNTMTVATLRAEAARGRLAIFKIGRRYYTTRGHVSEMIERCRVAQKDLASISIKSGVNGLSETERSSFAQAALEVKLKELTSRSPTISTVSTNRRRVGRH